MSTPASCNLSMISAAFDKHYAQGAAVNRSLYFVCSKKSLCWAWLYFLASGPSMVWECGGGPNSLYDVVNHISKDLMYPKSVCCRLFTYCDAVVSSSGSFASNMMIEQNFSEFSGNGLSRAVCP